MAIRKQFTVGLENKPAQLAKLCSILDRAEVIIEAISVVDGTNCSWVRFIAAPTNAAAAAIRKAGLSFTKQNVLVKQFANFPGQLHVLTTVLASRGHNIHYTYGSGSATTGTPLTLVISVDDVFKAEKDVRGVKA